MVLLAVLWPSARTIAMDTAAARRLVAFAAVGGLAVPVKRSLVRITVARMEFVEPIPLALAELDLLGLAASGRLLWVP